MALGLFCRRNHIIAAGIWASEFNVVFNRIGKKIDILEDHRNMIHEIFKGVIFYVLSSKANLS